MGLLKELYQNIKENDISFSRGEVTDDDTDIGMSGSSDDTTDLDGGDDMPPDSDIDDGMPPEGGDDQFGEDDDSVSISLSGLIRAMEWAQEVEDAEQIHSFVESLLDAESESGVVDVDQVEDAIASLEGADDGMDDDMSGNEFDDDMAGDEEDPDSFGSEDDMPVRANDNPENDPISGSTM